MTEERSNRLNLQMDDVHSLKLARVAERLYLQPGTALLEAIPGAWERAQQGAADADARRVIDLDDL